MFGLRTADGTSLFRSFPGQEQYNRVMIIVMIISGYDPSQIHPFYFSKAKGDNITLKNFGSLNNTTSLARTNEEPFLSTADSLRGDTNI